MSVSREEQGFSFLEEEPEEEVPEEEETAADPLAELEPEMAERMRGLLQEREQATRAQIRQGLQQHGLDVTDDGAPALRDAQKLGWLGMSPPPPVSLSPPPPVSPSPPAAEEPDDEVPDPVMEPVKFRTWHQRSLERAVQAAVAPLTQTMQAQIQNTLESAIELAMAKVPHAIQNFAPRFQDLLAHPEFDGRMRQALQSFQPQQWKDPQNLARIAAVLAIDLDGGQAPAAAKPRDGSGRFAPVGSDVGRAAISRATLAQAGPSREAGRQSRAGSPTDVDQAIGQALGISAEEAALLRQDTTGDASAQLRKERLGKMRGGRR